MVDGKKEVFDILSLMPDDTPECMAFMWVGCLSFAAGEQGIVEQFEKDTGNRYVAPRNGLEASIDEATGLPQQVVREFVLWVNENVWGSWSGGSPR